MKFSPPIPCNLSFCLLCCQFVVAIVVVVVFINCSRSTARLTAVCSLAYLGRPSASSSSMAVVGGSVLPGVVDIQFNLVPQRDFLHLSYSLDLYSVDCLLPLRGSSFNHNIREGKEGFSSV